MRRWCGGEPARQKKEARLRARGGVESPPLVLPVATFFFRQIEEGMEDLDVLPLMFGCDLLLLCGCMKNDKQVSHVYFDLL
jgi:hypothetical protein